MNDRNLLWVPPPDNLRILPTIACTDRIQIRKTLTGLSPDFAPTVSTWALVSTSP